ncbi:hypothetical protein [Aquimarina brevivitae]|uniref:Uncharacterized protein n=1 Tax=Aquimarina brevivitae TaxID=323412 RepID=A0A4V2F5S7_9FLAO|nr:hypothetical protein [Aquimarina brevivitae]RZS93859.1 hypothetical protein EV197_2440 [Aquimarina brevivitae]
MKLENTKQTWQGSFSYLEDHSNLVQHIEVPFIMQIEEKEGSFFGTSVDDESKEVFDQPAMVTGFFEENMVSFILKYPYSYYRNEEGVLIVDKNKEHPDIHYTGFYDPDSQDFQGNWELVLDKIFFGNDYLEEVLQGPFEMKRIK